MGESTARLRRASAAAALAVICLAPAAGAQAAPDATLEAIRREGMERSGLVPLAQALLDSIGPRLTGSPEERAAHAWVAERYRGWGLAVRAEPYGEWSSWRRGTLHVDLLEPRVRTLEASLLAWSPGTRGAVAGRAIVLPELASPAEFERWLATEVRGKWVLVSAPQPTCRPDDQWERWATPAALERMRGERATAAAAWDRRAAASGASSRWVPMRLEEAGAAGVIALDWGGGANQVHNAWTVRAPMLALGCEDYGLVFRLAAAGQRPVLRVDATAEFAGEAPVVNTVATIPGAELPNEYVVLSAHLDSWDAAAGATDNGAGTATVMEAARILRAVLPRPRRTILIAHWSGEEQGLNGSLAFAEDHPEVVAGLQALFNLDGGTGRVRRVSAQGLAGAGEPLRRWLDRLPGGLGAAVQVDAPGTPDATGSDHVSFVCRGAPAFDLEQVPWEYRTHTWHTDRDSFDKLVIDDLRANAVLVAMLAYLAAEEPARLSRDRAPGAPLPACRTPSRSVVEFLERLLQ